MHWLYRRLGVIGPWYMCPPEGDPPTGGGAPARKKTRRDDDDPDDDAPDTATLVTSLTTRYGDATRALGVLATENRNLRRWKREARDNPESLLPEGAIVITKADQDELTAFRALGKKPAELKTALEDATKLQGELDKKKAEELYTEAAGMVKYHAKVLTDLVQAKGLHLELREETVEGKTVKVPYVRKADDKNAPLTKLNDEYVQQQFPEYLVALKQDAGTPQQSRQLPRQGSAGTTGNEGAATLVDKALANNAKAAGAGNAIKPAKAVTTT